MYNEQSSLVYTATKASGVRSASDICCFSQLRVYPNKKNRIVLTYFSNQHIEKICPPKVNHVRKKIPFGGLVIEPLEGNFSFVQFFVVVDMVGSDLPIVQSFGEISASNMLLEMAEGLKKNLPSLPSIEPTKCGRSISEDFIIKDVLYSLPHIAKFLNPSCSIPMEIDIPVNPTVLMENETEKKSKQIQQKICAILQPATSCERKNECMGFIEKYNGQLAIFVSILPAIVWYCTKYVIFSSDSFRALVLSLSFGVSIIIVSLISKRSQSLENEIYALFASALILPTVVFFLLGCCFPINYVFRALIGLVIVLRALLVAMLGRPAPNSTRCGDVVTGTVTCHLNIELRGILRYMSIHKSKNKDSDEYVPVNATHIVVKALAQALSEENILNYRKVCIPYLGLKGVYCNKGIDILVALTGSEQPEATSQGAMTTVKLADVDKMSVKDIADTVDDLATDYYHQVSSGWYASGMEWFYFPLHFMSVILDKNLTRFTDILCGSQFASCVVLSCPNSKQSEVVDVDVAPCCTDILDPTIIVSIGGARATWKETEFNCPSSGHVLVVTMIINNPACDVGICRKFATRVEELVQYPYKSL